MSRLRHLFHRRALCCVALISCVLISPLTHGEELTVSAAASLSDAFKQIGKAFEAAKPGTSVVFNFGASGALLQQLAQGAPVDVFASADLETMDRAASQALIVPGSHVAFAANRLVLVLPVRASTSPKSLLDLATMGYRRIAIGNPAFVPAGRYALEATDAAGVTEALKDRFIYADSVRQVLAYVARREVDTGFVYRTDALADREHVRIALELSTKAPTLYPVVQLSAAKHPILARAFIAYLLAAPAQAVLARYGFQRP